MTWEIAEDFPNRIRQLRRVLGSLTQDQFGLLVGVNGRQVLNWEKGNQRPYKKNLARWADEHGWPLEMFQEGGRMPLDVFNATPAERSSGSWKEGPPDQEGAQPGCALAQDTRLQELARSLLIKAAEERCSPDLKDLILKFERQLDWMEKHGCARQAAKTPLAETGVEVQ